MDNDRADRIENKIDRIVDQIGEINTTLAAQHMSLELHIKRTNTLEEKLIPIEHRHYELKGIIKLGGIIIGSISILAMIAEILTYINHH